MSFRGILCQNRFRLFFGEVDKITIHIDNQIRILKSELTTAQINNIEEELTLINPRWEQKNQFSKWKNKEPKYLMYYRYQAGVMLLPRGYIHALRKELPELELIDRTRLLESVDFGFKGELHGYQKIALRDVCSRRFGVLEAPPGAGKTVMALAIIAQRAQPTLVVVHTKELMYQWRERILDFCNLTEDEIGLIGDGHNRPGSKITVAIINSLYRCSAEIRDSIGHLVVDECHHIPARTFTEAISHFDCRFMLGLSATPYRRDRLTKLIHLYLGDTTHRLRPRELQSLERIMRAHLVVRPTGRRYMFDTERYQRMIKALVEDKVRNRMIAADVHEQMEKHAGLALVISDRVDHCRELHRLITEGGLEAHLLIGQTPSSERATIVDDLNCSRVTVLVATSQLIGEGFDIKHLSSIFMATPVRFSGRVKQYIGRILRTAEDKEHAFIFDYVDESAHLKKSYQSRLRTYQEMGVILPQQEI